MIYARVDVMLLQHHRVLRIPRDRRAAALGVWLAGLLYTRGHDLDGFVPHEAIDQIAADGAVENLIAVGLFSTHEQDGVHGYLLFRYPEHNETKAQVQHRRNSLQERVKRHRNKLPKKKKRVVPVFDSVYVSDLDLGSPSPSGSRLSTEPAVVGLTDVLPDELRAAADMVGVRDVDAAWIKFTGFNNGRDVQTLRGGLAGAWQAWCGEEVRRARAARGGPAEPTAPRELTEADLAPPADALTGEAAAEAARKLSEAMAAVRAARTVPGASASPGPKRATVP